MRPDPARDAWLKKRLKEAIDKFADGSVDAFARQLGYANGGYLREILADKKPVREAIIERTHGVPKMAGWFSRPEDPAPPVYTRSPASAASSDAHWRTVAEWAATMLHERKRMVDPLRFIDFVDVLATVIPNNANQPEATKLIERHLRLVA